MPRLVRYYPTKQETPAEELLLSARSSVRRLYAALTLVLSLNLAVVSGTVTFYTLALR